MATDEELGVRCVDAAFHWTGLLVRAAIYTFFWSVADTYDCGRALLTGLLVGDIAGHLLALLWQWRDGMLQIAAEIALLGLVWLFVRTQTIWPDEPSLRAVLGLAAFGVFVGKVGGTLLTQLGPTERGFA
jgi:hypothetical protein